MRLTNGVENTWHPNFQYNMRLRMLPRYLGVSWVEPCEMPKTRQRLVRRFFGVPSEYCPARVIFVCVI